MGEDYFEGIEDLISQHKNDIQKRVTSGIHEHKNFRRLRASLNTYTSTRPSSGIFVIMIRNDEITKLEINDADLFFENLDEEIMAGNNHLLLDYSGNTRDRKRTNFENGNEARRFYCDLSKKGYCIFLITTKDLHYFAHGDDIGNTIFYTTKDKSKFNELKDVNEIGELFDEFQNYIEKRHVYQNFFVSKATLLSLHEHLINRGEISKPKDSETLKRSETEFISKNKNLLENKPEDRLRESLRNFLEDNLKGTVFINKEIILESFKRIDIFIHDEYGEIFLIEVKWVGKSIHFSGKKFGTEYTLMDVNPGAARQTINYIFELSNKKLKNVKVGYLIVFDARTGDNIPDTFHDFSLENLEVKNPPFKTRFKKIKDLKISNNLPT